MSIHLQATGGSLFMQTRHDSRMLVAKFSEFRVLAVSGVMNFGRLMILFLLLTRL